MERTHVFATCDQGYLMFEVTVKRTFKASHYLTNSNGTNESPHDHDWIIEAKFKSDDIDEDGCAIDFRCVDQAFLKIFEGYRGNTINDHEPFTKISPSAENLARHLYEKITDMLKNERAHLISITAWEDENHGATYLP